MTNAVLEAMELIGKFTADVEKFDVVKREVFLYPDDNKNWRVPPDKVLRVSLELITPEEAKAMEGQ